MKRPTTRLRDGPLIKVIVKDKWTDPEGNVWSPGQMVLLGADWYAWLRSLQPKGLPTRIERVVGEIVHNGLRFFVELTCGGRPKYSHPWVDGQAMAREYVATKKAVPDKPPMIAASTTACGDKIGARIHRMTVSRRLPCGCGRRRRAG